MLRSAWQHSSMRWGGEKAPCMELAGPCVATNAYPFSASFVCSLSAEQSHTGFPTIPAWGKGVLLVAYPELPEVVWQVLQGA